MSSLTDLSDSNRARTARWALGLALAQGTLPNIASAFQESLTAPTSTVASAENPTSHTQGNRYKDPEFGVSQAFNPVQVEAYFKALQAAQILTVDDLKNWIEAGWLHLNATLEQAYGNARVLYYTRTKRADLSDEERKIVGDIANKVFEGTVVPIWERGVYGLFDILMSDKLTPLREQLGEEYKEFLIYCAEQRALYAEKNLGAVPRERDQSADRYKKVTGATIRALSAQIATINGDPDREKRKVAFDIYVAKMSEIETALTDTLKECIERRHQIAESAGCNNYVEWCARTQRWGIIPAELKLLLDTVKEDFVPLLREVYAARAKSLGIEGPLRPYDLKVPVGSKFKPEQYLEGITGRMAALRIVAGILDPSFATIIEGNTTEAVVPTGVTVGEGETARELRIPVLNISPATVEQGLYTFNNPASPGGVIYMSRIPNDGTLLHENTHQWHNSLMQGLPTLIRPPKFAMETFAISLEYIYGLCCNRIYDDTTPSNDRNGSTDAQIAARSIYENLLTQTVELAIFTEFELWMYENPEASPEARNQEFARIYASFDLGLDLTDYEHFYTEFGWSRYGALITSPFSSTHHLVGNIASLHIVNHVHQDRRAGLNSLMDAMRLGGGADLPTLLETAGVKVENGQLSLTPDARAERVATFRKLLETQPWIKD